MAAMRPALAIFNLDVANERNFDRNQLFPELGAIRGFQRVKISSSGWGAGRGGGAGRRSAPGAHGGPSDRGGRGRAAGSAPREVPATPPPPPAPSPAAFLSLSQPLPPRVTSKFREKPRGGSSSGGAIPPPSGSSAPGWGGRSSEPAGSLSPPGRPRPPTPAARRPPAPNLSGKVTFFIKRIHFQGYFRPRKACPAAESDRKRGKVRVFFIFFIFFPRRRGRCEVGRTDGRRSRPLPVTPAAPGTQPGSSSDLARRLRAQAPARLCPRRVQAPRSRRGQAAVPSPEAPSHLVSLGLAWGGVGSDGSSPPTHPLSPCAPVPDLSLSRCTFF